ncbi:MAG: HRDC domain-containing protein, partial [Rhodospirillales bacterium]
TDWAMRPLRESQIKYALSDVTHLREAYEKLERKLAGNGRGEWLAEEMKILTSPATYDADPMEAYKRIKSRSGSSSFLAVLREVAAWREREARRRDTTRNRVIRDEQILEISHHPPKSPEDLARIRGLGRKLAHGEAGRKVLEAVKRGLDTPEAERPRPKPKSDIPRGLGPITDLLKVLLKMKCEESDVAQKLLASSADLERIAAFGAEAEVPALHGWRLEVFGNDALKLRRGEMALTLKGRHMALIDTQT